MSIMNANNSAWLSKKLVSMPRRSKVSLMIVVDSIALPLCVLTAMLLRLADLQVTISYGYGPYILISLITIFVFIVSGLYRAVIRFIDRHLLVRTGIGLAVVIAFSFSISYIIDDKRLPRNVLMIYWFIAFSYVVSSRLSVRSFLRINTGMNPKIENVVAIYGAGEAGVQLAQAMSDNGKYRPVCFFDDKHQFSNRNVAGLQVFHTDRQVEVINQMGIGLIVLAIPSASPSRRRQVMHLVRRADIPVKILNNLIELDDKITARSIREIRIEDLLGRDPIPPQAELFAKCIHGQNVLVTGAGGSIGSELCRQIMTLSPRGLHLLDHCEYALYNVKQELLASFPGLPMETHLGSVCDARLVQRIMREGSIDTVYHAAAYKHVPLVETNIAEGIRNNVVGAQVIADAAEKLRIKTCVLISTDKAVRPTNIMGASKRIAELIFQAAAAKSVSGTTYCMVRFGNVLGSSGSVVPLFKWQIENGGPITITHPDVVRYFMLIPEAAQLVMQAGAMAKGGEVFVLDMGEPIKIIDLARTMIEMSGLTEKNQHAPDGEIQINCVGLRPGEKLYEELLIGNNAHPSAHPKIMHATEYAIDSATLNKMIDDLLAICGNNNPTHIKAIVKTIVAEYTPQKNVELPLNPRIPRMFPNAALGNNLSQVA
jgi:FlaA1/EpsC-like NDP-sugar epimerase